MPVRIAAGAENDLAGIYQRRRHQRGPDGTDGPDGADVLLNRLAGVIEGLDAPFWAHHNGLPGNADWADKLGRSRNKVRQGPTSFDTATLLAILFDPRRELKQRRQAPPGRRRRRPARLPAADLHRRDDGQHRGRMADGASFGGGVS